MLLQGILVRGTRAVGQVATQAPLLVQQTQGQGQYGLRLKQLVRVLGVGGGGGQGQISHQPTATYVTSTRPAPATLIPSLSRDSGSTSRIPSFSSSSSSSSSSSFFSKFSSQSGGGEDDTHNDFKPQFKQHETIQDVVKVIEEDVNKHNIFVYMKGIPEMPQCGFSNMVCRILDTYGKSTATYNFVFLLLLFSSFPASIPTDRRVLSHIATRCTLWQ